MINIRLDATLQTKLWERLWADDWAKMPHHLYLDTSQSILGQQWRRAYEPLFAGQPVSEAARRLFAPATPADLQPCYLADPDEQWYAVIIPRYNTRTKYRFCYVRYWWAANSAARRAMVQGALQTWDHVPFDWLKIRLGYGSTLSPTEFHPRAVIQNYVVAGRLQRETVQAQLRRLDLSSFIADQPHAVKDSWWRAYRLLLDEQEQLAPDLEDWNDYETALTEARREMVRLLKMGGGIINLFAGHQPRLIGHISWEPSRYDEQLIARCWHINNIIVAADCRRRRLGETLHHLAAGRMNLATTPIVAGLITAGNEASLKTAAKIGRHIVDTYIIIPKEE